MKRFWLVLLSLGLVMAFSVSALAVDVKFSGEYYAAGMYLNKVVLQKGPSTKDFSTQFFFQRLRLGTDFIVSPCLKLVTRADIMEGVWGGKEDVYTKDDVTLGSSARNMEWELTYIEYVSPVGLFKVGYQLDYGWGTIWGNRTTGPTAGQIQYILPIPNTDLTMFFGYAKEKESNYWIDDKGVTTDADFDSYRVGPIYKFNSSKAAGEAGLLFIFNHDKGNRIPATGYTERGYVLMPYFKAKVGPLALQGEVNYYWGERIPEVGSGNTRIDSLTAWLDGDATFGIFSVGGSAAFVQGDDNADVINNRLSGGRDWDPCLIMFNNTTTNLWVGAISGWDGSAAAGEMRNAWFGQLRAGVNPTPQLNATVSVSYAEADKKPAGFDKSSYGWEVDVTGTYKITNNLSYMLGVGYLLPGEYYKGVSTKNQEIVNDDYMLINKLTLNF